MAAAIGLACLVGLTLAPPATARKRHVPFSAGFSVAGSNGYRISVDGWSDSVRILVTRGPVRIAKHVVLVEYTGPGAASPQGISADFGSLGSISMQFQPSGKRETRTSPKNCSPHKVRRRLGTFVGSFRFAGGDGYTTAELTEATGSEGRADDLLCGRLVGAIGGHPPPRFPYLAAANSVEYDEAGFLGFSASVRRNRRRVFLAATLREQIGAVGVRRYVARVAPRSSFRVRPHLRAATVSPPAPFAGTARFKRRGKNPPAWSGSLSASFPGKPDVPLTGPPFTNVELSSAPFPVARPTQAR